MLGHALAHAGGSGSLKTRCDRGLYYLDKGHAVKVMIPFFVKCLLEGGGKRVTVFGKDWFWQELLCIFISTYVYL
jgi:hypothetical protein